MLTKFVVRLLALLLSFSLSSALFANDFAANMLGPGFTYNKNYSQQNSSSRNFGPVFMYMRIPGAKTQVGIYQYNGNIDQAIASIPIPPDSDVTDKAVQYAAANLGMFLEISKGMKEIDLNSEWRTRAASKVIEWSDVKYLSYRISRGMAIDDEDMKVGDKIDMISIETRSPFVDYNSLTVVPGTWAVVYKTSFVVSDEMMEDDEGDEYGWGDEEQGGSAVDPGIKLMDGSRKFDTEATIPYNFGENNYLVENSLEAARKFYLEVSGKHCRVDDEYEMLHDEKTYTAVTIYCLDKSGNIAPGDKIIAITLSAAPKEILSDILGRNQGTWTLVSISSWVEESY